MSYIQSFILGIIQGLTEFLPISSSAHLVLVPYLFNWSIPEDQIFPFDVLVQLGTLLAVILYFWTDLIAIIKGFFKGLANKEPFKDFEARMGWYLIVATIPAGILGMLIKNQVEAAFSSPKITALFLFGTAGLLLLADLVGKRTRSLEDLTWWDALWIGIFQAISIFPGISRSGATISGGMTRNLDRSSSARFSFLMSIPVMLGASLASLKDLLDVPNLSAFLPILLVGFLTAAIVGYLSIHWLLSFIKRQKFYAFSIYCVVLACIVLLVSALNTNNASAVASTSTPVVSSSTEQATVEPVAQTTPNGQFIRINYSPSVNWIIPTLSGCAGALRESSLVTLETPTSSLALANSDMIIRWGAPENLSEPSYQIGNEVLTIIVNSENPLVSLTGKISRNLFSGQYETWGDLRKACPDCFDKGSDGSIDDSAIKLAFYPANEDIQTLFDQAVMNTQPVASSIATLIPDPQAMVEYIEEEKSGIGFIPSKDKEDDLKEIKLKNFDEGSLNQPVLVIVPSVPQDNQRELLLCLQNMLNPK